MRWGSYLVKNCHVRVMCLTFQCYKVSSVTGLSYRADQSPLYEKSPTHFTFYSIFNSLLSSSGRLRFIAVAFQCGDNFFKEDPPLGHNGNMDVKMLTSIISHCHGEGAIR